MSSTSRSKGSLVNVPVLVAAIADAYTVGELTTFLGDYFKTRLDHIINPTGIPFPETVRAVVEYFQRRHTLQDLVREIQKDRPDAIDFPSILLSPSTAPSIPVGGAPPPLVGTPAPQIDIDSEEVEFYFVIEPDRRTVAPPSPTRPKSSIYVRIPVVGASASTSKGLPRALSLVIDRSGSMSGGKIDIARSAADYLLKVAEQASSHVAIIAFDDRVDKVVPLQVIVNAASHKAQVHAITPRGGTDLFAAWKCSADELRTLREGWDRRVVLITDGQLNHGMVDPVRFEREVRSAWKQERIATSCISMGNDWNVDLLNRLAAAGGGSIHFMKDEHQAAQALHEAFHAGRGVVASNVRVELEPLGSAVITQVQGVSTLLPAGHSTVHSVSGQLRTNVEEYLIVRIEFASPQSGQGVEIMRCKLFYEDPITAETRSTPEKVLTVYGDEATGARQSVVSQGVVCAAHMVMSRQVFKQALGAFLHGDATGGQALVEQARFTLESAPAPRAYLAAVNLQDQRIHDIERFEGRVPAEYIKERYIEELSHRDVVWMKLCEVLDRLVGRRNEIPGEYSELFWWANRMVDELGTLLPVQGDSVSREHERMDQPRRVHANEETNPAEEFWKNKANEWIGVIREAYTNDIDQRTRQGEDDEEYSRTSRTGRHVFVVAGACFGFERRRQGTREELTELMDSYLRGRMLIRGRQRSVRG